MTESEACNILRKEYPDYKLLTVTDYKGYYVFVMQPKNMPDACLSMENPTAVEKSTGKTFTFHPMLNDPKAYFKAVRENSHSVDTTEASSYSQKVEAGKNAIAHALGREMR